MIEHELILLGLLYESPKHGYEIKLKIKEVLSLFAGVDLKSIYYPLRILEEKGLVVKRVSKPGPRPKRFVYSLTAKGKNRFTNLLTKSFLNFKRPQFSLDLSLYFLNYIKPDIAQRRLRARLLLLKKLSKSLAQMLNALRKKRPASLIYPVRDHKATREGFGVSNGVNILEHNLQMVETEAKFLQRLLEDTPNPLH